MLDQIKQIQEQALAAAVKGQWTQAIEKNKELIAANPKDITSFLRLGYAYLQSGNLTEAKKAYNRALEIQPVNQIARNNLDKIKIIGSDKGTIDASTSQIDPNLFLNVIGKTKVVELLNIGLPPIVARLKVGEEVYCKVKKRRLEIRDKDNNYIGAFPDDISKRLIYFMDEGSTYAIYVKDANKSTVSVFVKEIKKGKTVHRYTSFPKNIQDDLKLMHQDEFEEGSEKEHDSEDEETETENDKEAPVDIEALAEEAPTHEYYSDSDVNFEDDFDDEEE
jgi:tetratricopeptide (TPR) repeat protein